MPQQFIEEYLVAVKPDVDLNAWKSASGNIEKELTGIFDTVNKKQRKIIEDATQKINEYTKKIKLLTEKRGAEGVTDERKSEIDKEIGLFKEQIGKQREIQSKASEQIELNSSKYTKNIKASSIALGIFVSSVKMAYEAAQKFAEEAINISNKFVSQGSVFVDKGTRDTMAKFGVSATQAQGLNLATDILGIDYSDFSKLTQGQRKAFSELMDHYQKGLNSIDPSKLDRFNKATQEYQLTIAKFQMDLQMAKMKLFAENESIPRLLDTLSEGLEGITDLLSSDAFQIGFNAITDIINGILKFVTAPINFLGKLFKGESGNTTTNNNTANVNVNVKNNGNGNFNSEQLAVDIGLEVQNVLSR